MYFTKTHVEAFLKIFKKLDSKRDENNKSSEFMKLINATLQHYLNIKIKYFTVWPMHMQRYFIYYVLY